MDSSYVDGATLTLWCSRLCWGYSWTVAQPLCGYIDVVVVDIVLGSFSAFVLKWYDGIFVASSQLTYLRAVDRT